MNIDHLTPHDQTLSELGKRLARGPQAEQCGEMKRHDDRDLGVVGLRTISPMQSGETTGSIVWLTPNPFSFDGHQLKLATALIGLVLLYGPCVFAQDPKTDTRPGIAPDIRDDETKLKMQRGDFVVVPIPIANPTLGTGLVAGAAYFYPQTEEQKKLQPASLTAAAGMYTSNDSKAFAVVQQNYWNNDQWRSAVIRPTSLTVPPCGLTTK